MGGESKTTQTQSSSTTPYAGAQGSLDDLLLKLGGKTGSADLTGAESSAFDKLQSNANAGNPFQSAYTNLASGLLSGGGAQSNDAAISGNLADYKGLLAPYANGSMIGNNTALKAQLDTIANDVQSRVNGMFAGSGRDLSASNQQALARGIAEGTAPVIASQFNTDTDRALNAASSIYGAGNTTFGLLNNTQQQANANAVTGVDVGSKAVDATNYGPMQTLAIEAQKRGIPLDTLTTLLGTVSPVAQAFGTTTGSGTTTQKANPLQTIVGGLLGGATLLSKFSDARLKTDIKRVGRADNGLPIYVYRYKGSPVRELGFMAQDVERVRPDAVFAHPSGFKMVNYGQAVQ